MTRWLFLAFAALLAHPGTALAADSVMIQCGQQYQAAKAAGTLGGQTWNQYRSDCAARLKAPSGAAATPAVAPAPAAATPDVAAPAPAAAPITTAASKATSGGRAAMQVRQKQCGGRVARPEGHPGGPDPPGLTWPKYWSLCNTRLKAPDR